MRLFGGGDKSDESAKNYNRLKCSFCGKSQDMVKKLIAGPGVYICDECVCLCLDILEDEHLGPADSISSLPFLSGINKKFTSDSELNSLIDEVLEPLEKINGRFEDESRDFCFGPGVSTVLVLKSIQNGRLDANLLPLLDSLGAYYRRYGQYQAAKNTYEWAVEICAQDDNCDEKTKRFFAIELAKLLMRAGEYSDGEALLDKL
mgnify:CR=1 FL=1